MAETTRPNDKALAEEYLTEPIVFSDGKADDTFASDGKTPRGSTPTPQTFTTGAYPSNPIIKRPAGNLKSSGVTDESSDRSSSPAPSRAPVSVTIPRRIGQALRRPLDILLEGLVLLVEKVLDNGYYMAIFRKLLMVALAHCFFFSLGPTFLFLLIVIVPTLLIVICIHPGIPEETETRIR